MSWLFDTNACIHLMKLREPLTSRAREAGPGAIAVSSITLAELWFNARPMLLVVAFPALVMGVWWKRTTAAGAICGIIAGFAMMRLQPAWPAVNAFDRFLTILLPATAGIEWLAAGVRAVLPEHASAEGLAVGGEEVGGGDAARLIDVSARMDRCFMG